MPRQPSFDRDNLIVKAQDLFWSRGWAGTSMKDLERTLDLRPGSFYAAFGSKEALYELTLDRYAQNGKTCLNQFAEEFGPFEAIRKHVRVVLLPATGQVRACMLAKTYLELQAQNHPLALRADQYLVEIGHTFTRLFAEAQAAGQIRKDIPPERLARNHQALLIGMRVMAERLGGDPAELAADTLARLDELRLN